MGFFSFLQSDEQKRVNIVTKIGLEAGLFEECPVCRDVTESRNAGAVESQVYAAIQNYILSNDEGYSLFNRDVQTLKDKFKEVADKIPFACTCHNI